MAVTEESNSGPTSFSVMIDENYEFSAPQFFDFIKGESEEELRAAELWFDTALTYAPSPFMPRIKTGRTFTVESLCDFSQAEEIQKETSELSSKNTDGTSETKPQIQHVLPKMKDQVTPPVEDIEENNIVDSSGKGTNEINNGERNCAQRNESVSSQVVSSSVVINDTTCSANEIINKQGVQSRKEGTPVPAVTSKKGSLTGTNKLRTARKIASLIRDPSSLKPKSHLQSSRVKNIKPSSVKRETNVKNDAGTPNLALENQAIKRQKLEEGKSKQILNVKPLNLPHKSKLGLVSDNNNVCSSIGKEDRKIYVREKAVPFVSMAEMMRKFQTNTRTLSLPHALGSDSHIKAKLTLTRPKEPEFETAQRFRSVKVKSSAELEEEMMAKMPKFKARPFNKKIFKASTLPPIPRSTPQPPEFQEFHLETTERANNHAETASVASIESTRQRKEWKPHFTEPKTPVLQTSLRARPTAVKSSLEIEQEELEKCPKFKARPLNKKIFESKGDLGIFCNTKKHITMPQEFHFATDERIPPSSSSVTDLFDKLSLNSESRRENKIPKNTTPNPFHLQTEERGAEKERKFIMEVVQKQLEEGRARIPKAKPYPYTTDYPVIPPKPEPKHCTRPEPFQLESLVRHEEEIQREMEEIRRKEEEEAQMRIFKAQPILREDPIPVPEKVRRPLTHVQEFDLHVDNRAVDRAEFDQKVKEKEMMYKRYREESEAARMLEEERALNSESRRENKIPKNTTPNPFHLQTEERGAEKERKFIMEVVQKQLEEGRARIPKAKPYPYTTDYPVIPPKPEPKHCTRPEPFQLESLVRHEEEIQREMEEIRRKEEEEAQMRIFKAQPILREDPIPVPEKVRRPLTHVQEFDLHVDNRAVDRAEFDQKVKEKEMMYKRYREESEAARMLEEERALKQLRRTLVPRAKPAPNFDHPFCPQKSSKETTKAKSPKLRVLQIKAKRRAVNDAISSAAANMR